MEQAYLLNESWFEVSRYPASDDSRPYILVINSYGRLRKLFTDTGSYEDVSDGGLDKERK